MELISGDLSESRGGDSLDTETSFLQKLDLFQTMIDFSKISK